MTAVARFNTGYGQASVTCTAMAKALGRTDVKITVKKIRGQLQARCKEEISNLRGTEIRGDL